jgi:hypothetical protein
MKLVYGLCVFLLLFTACGEIFEENINSDQVTLLAPGDSLQTSTYAQNFIWQEVFGARTYHLQIAQPSFDSLRTIVLDTILRSTTYTYSLSPGKYQWRVKAENAGYQTAYSVRSLEIFPSSLAQQRVILNSPGNDLLSNQGQVSFSWSALFGAKSYTLQVDSNNFSDTTRLVLNQQLVGKSYTLSISKDQNYQWRVRAQNDTARSAWSLTRRFNIDTKSPATVVLNSPAKSASVNLPVNLTWQTISDANRYELFIYAADSTTLITSFPQTLTTGTFTFSNGNVGDRFVWRVRARDIAGNTGTFSEYRSFLIQ